MTQDLLLEKYHKDFHQRRQGLYNSPHLTKNIIIDNKNCSIDESIISSVELINNLGGKTKYSCHGDYMCDGFIQSPYIIFLADFSLIEKLSKIFYQFSWKYCQKYMMHITLFPEFEIKLIIDYRLNYLRWRVEWSDRLILEYFNKFLEEQNLI